MPLLKFFLKIDPMQALAFYIDAPLQSWGSASKFQHRETNRFPTKSAIVGLIAAAMGINKHSEDEATELAPIVDLKLTVVRLEKKAKPSSRFTDFHTYLNLIAQNGQVIGTSELYKSRIKLNHLKEEIKRVASHAYVEDLT